MKFLQTNFVPLIFGNDINVYSLARAFHEEYSIKSLAVGKTTSGPCYKSKIISYMPVPNIDNAQVFLKTVTNIADLYPDKKIILLGCGDNYITSISKFKNDYPQNVIVPYLDIDLLLEFTQKEKFYKILDKYNIKYPKTKIISSIDDCEIDFKYPIILKPSDSAIYFDNDFDGQKKVYLIKNHKEYTETITKIYDSGYDNTLIIQEYIPGDDSCLRISVNYSGQDSKTKLIALGHALLEEHTPKGIGNLSLLYLDYDKNLMTKLQNFLDDIGFIGFSSFDMKYDARDGEYKIFELNARQPRSNFFCTGAGFNIAKFIVDDYINGQNQDIIFAKGEILWTVIPKKVALQYVNNIQMRNKVMTLYHKKRVINPMFYKGDNNLFRQLSIIKSHFSHYKKYKENM